MSTVYAQELQIQRLQKFILTHAAALSDMNGRNLIREAIEEGILHEGDLYKLPH